MKNRAGFLFKPVLRPTINKKNRKIDCERYFHIKVTKIS